jgi:hypothetical protein
VPNSSNPPLLAIQEEGESLEEFKQRLQQEISDALASVSTPPAPDTQESKQS